MTKPIRIIQTAAARSGSTVLSNILVAYFQPYESLAFMGKYTYSEEFLEKNIVVKSHDKDLDDWLERFGNKYNLYFIISDRGDYDWSDYYHYENALFIKYEELLETKDNSLEKISKNVYAKVKEVLPEEFMIQNREKTSIQNGINRITNMNDRYTKIKDKPFEYVDKYYQIHGHHKNNRQG